MNYPSSNTPPVPVLPKSEHPNSRTLKTPERQSPFSPLQIWKTLIRRRWYFIISFLLVSVTGVAYLATATPMYEASASVDLNPQNSSGGGLADLVQEKLGGDEANTHLQTEIRIMQSNSVLEQVASELRIGEISDRQSRKDRVSVTPQDQAALLRKDLKIFLQPGTNIVEISYRSAKPELAMQVPNAIVETYISKDLGSGVQGTARVSTWLNSQMQDLQRQVELAQRKLADFQRENNVIGVDESQNLLVDKLRLINTQVTAAQADRITKEAAYKLAQTRDPELISSIGGNPVLPVLRGQQVELMTQFNDASSKFGPKYPRVVELQKQLDTINATISGEVSKVEQHFQIDYLAAQRVEDGLRAQLEIQEQAIYKLSQHAAEYAMLRHNAEATRTLYDAISYKLKESGITDTLKLTQFRIVDQAERPSIPVAPRRSTIALSFLFAAVLAGIVVAMTVDQVDDAVYSLAQVESSLDLPILAATPHFNKEASIGSGANQAAGMPSLVVLSQPQSPIAESFRAMRSSMLLGFVDRRPQLQLITSSVPAEGKSLVSANYAITLAQRGAKVLLIDCDLRRGSQHKLFAMSSSPGLTNILSDPDRAAPLTAPIQDLPNFFVVPCGPVSPNPAELLHSRAFADLIAAWRQTFDYIVIDSAPLIPVADSLALANLADLVVLVARVGKTRMRPLHRVQEMLERTGGRPGGIVLNDVARGLDDYGYYYGDYKYEAKS